MYAGDYPTNHTAVCLPFATFAAATGAPTATTNFAAADVVIFKDGGTTQRTSANGITVSTSFDTNTGLQMIVIDLSDNSDAGFYAAGHEFQVAVADITADGQTLRFWAGCFSIERAGGVLALLKAGTAKVTLADGVAHGGTLGSSTATLALSRASIVSQSANTSAVTATGNGTGSGLVATSGSGATGDGIQATSAATNGNGFKATGNGTGDGLTATGGAGAGGDGIAAIAGGGTDLRAAAITGTLATLTTYTGNTPQTGDSFALVNGASGVVAIKSETAAIKAKTDNLPSDPADESLIIAATDAIFARLGAPAGASVSADLAAIDSQLYTVGDIVDGVLNEGILDGTITVREALRIMVAVLAGRLSGAVTPTVTIRNIANTQDVVVATVDPDGNRAATVVTP